MNPRTPDFARELPAACSLEEILDALALQAHAVPVGRLSEILSRYSEALQFARRTRIARLPDVEGELRGVHAREQGDLLREAAEIALSTTVEGRLLTAPLEPLPRLDAWAARCAEEIDCALADGSSVDGELLACCLGAPREWPSAAELIHAACRLSPSEVNSLCRARVQFASGNLAEARARYECARLPRLPLSRRAQLREVRGIAAEFDGCAPAALHHYESAAALGAGARANLAALLVALELGLERRAAWAVERLEDERPSSARLQRLVREACERRVILGRPVSRRIVARVGRSLAPAGGELAGRVRP